MTPATASLQTGATQQFSANVTGATNTSVTRSATGGAISSTGFYTAGNVAGNFSVTAVSAAESTKTAQAAVTITSPPPVPRQNHRRNNVTAAKLASAEVLANDVNVPADHGFC